MQTLARRVFGLAWAAGVPVVVTNVRRGYDWQPDTMARAIQERKQGALDTTIDVRPPLLPERCSQHWSFGPDHHALLHGTLEGVYHPLALQLPREA